MSSTSAPPPNFYSQQQFFNQPSGNNAFSPAAIAIISLLGAAFLIVSYHTAIAKFWTGSRGAFRRPGVSDEPGDPQEGATAFLTRGLEESVIQAIPVYTYSKADGLVDGSECSVCLGEFQNDESLRLLPKCNHAFHLSCIDQWLQSHSNCPLCRSNISDPALPRQPDSLARPPTVVTGEDYANAVLDMQIMHEAGNSAHLRDCSDQRSSEPRAYNPNDPQFTSFPEGEGTPRAEGPGTVDVSTRLNAPSLEDKINARNTEGYHDLQEQTSLVDLQSFSKNRAFIFGKDRKLPIVSRRRDGDATTIIQRSSSMDSIYHRSEVGLERFKQTIVYDLFPRNQGPQPLWYQPQDENAALSTTDIASVSVVVDMGTTGSSSSHVSPTDLVLSSSLNYETNLKNKADSVIGPQLEKRLLSFKGRPFIVKRSFSGGGLFGFRSKSTVGIVNTGLSV